MDSRLNNALLQGLSFTPYEHDSHGDAKRDQDDNEGPKSPTKVHVGVEEVGDLGASKDSRDGRRVVDPEQQQPVLESRHVSQHDGNDIAHADVTSPVDGVGSSVGLDVLGNGLQYQAEDDEDKHDDEALASSPDIDDLGDREREDAADDGGDDGGRR